MKNQKALYLLPIKESGGKDIVKAELWHEIHSRFKLKEPKKSIARSLGIDVRTVRKVLLEMVNRNTILMVSRNTMVIVNRSAIVVMNNILSVVERI